MKTTDEREILERENQSKVERDLMEKKSVREPNRDSDEYLCGCDSGKCFDCGI